MHLPSMIAVADSVSPSLIADKVKELALSKGCVFNLSKPVAIVTQKLVLNSIAIQNCVIPY